MLGLYTWSKCISTTIQATRETSTTRGGLWSPTTPRHNLRISTTEATHSDWDGLCIQSPLYSQHQFTSAQQRLWTISFHDNPWSKQHTAANHRGCERCNYTLYFTIYIQQTDPAHLCMYIHMWVALMYIIMYNTAYIYDYIYETPPICMCMYLCMWLYKMSTLYSLFKLFWPSTHAHCLNCSMIAKQLRISSRHQSTTQMEWQLYHLSLLKCLSMNWINSPMQKTS